MSQTRIRNYKHKLQSFDHNVFNLGLHGPGRYYGFDTMVRISALAFSINHNGGDLNYKDPLNTTHGPIGLAMTPQGDLIMEDDVITGFEVDSNSGNSRTRYDLVVMNHNHTVVPGGQNATYAIIKGPIGDPSFPALTEPLKQTIIGWLEMPEDADDVTNCFYVKAPAPDSGDNVRASLNGVNAFKATQQQKKSDNPITNYFETYSGSGVDARLWSLPNDGNVYEILPSTDKTLDGLRIFRTELQDGVRIYLRVNEHVTLRNTDYFVTPLGYRGYKGLALPQGLCNVEADASAGSLGILGLKPSAGEIWELEFVLDNDKWYLSKIGGANKNSMFTRGMQIMWRGDTTLNFDTSGLGKNLMEGFQMVNGLRGTDDARGKIVAVSDTIPSVGAADITAPSTSYVRGDVGDTDGVTDFLIEQTNLPNYNLTVNDPGHTHPTLNPIYYTDASGGTSNPSLKGDNSDNSSSPISVASAVTGISVNSAGGGTRLAHIPPVYFTALIQKL